MEDFKKAALAYYETAPAEVKQVALQAFGTADADGNGRITYAEFLQLISESEAVPPAGEADGGAEARRMFNMLDNNGDGTLDYEEFITLFYLSLSGGPAQCDGCKAVLATVHFSCLECHINTTNSYDLCFGCYCRGDHSHPHSDFADNHSLLRMYKKLMEAEDLTVNTEEIMPQLKWNSSSSSTSIAPAEPSKSKIKEKIVNFNTGVAFATNAVNVGTIVAESVCSIM